MPILSPWLKLEIELVLKVESHGKNKNKNILTQKYKYEFFSQLHQSHVYGIEVRNFWRIRVGSQFGFVRWTWHWKGSKLGFSGLWAWDLGSAISGQTSSKFRLFREVWMGSKFGFVGRTWVQVSSKFDLSNSKQFEVRYIWVRSNTIVTKEEEGRYFSSSSFSTMFRKKIFTFATNIISRRK